MAGGKRRPSNKSKPRRPNASSSRPLFVEGDILDDFRTPPSFRGKRNNPNSVSGAGTRGSDRVKASNSINGMKKPVGSAVRYVYPSSDLQGYFTSEYDLEAKNADNPSKGSKPVILNSKGSKIMIYEDNSPPSEDIKVEYKYDYDSGFVLGESSHRGLGFSGEAEATEDIIEQSEGELKDENSHRGLGFSGKPELNFGEMVSSSKNTEEELVDFIDSSPPVEETDTGKEDFVGEDDSEMPEAFLDESPPRRKNAAFLSIGGRRLYTEDISEGESDKGEAESSEEGSSSEYSDSDTFESASDIDDDVAEDYVEGICGGDETLDAKWLAKLNIDAPQQKDDEDSVSSSIDDADCLEKMSSISVQEASREYGSKNPQSRKKKIHVASGRPGSSNTVWSSALDDMMLVKDPRRLSKKKRQAAQFPGSWPSGSRKSKSFRTYPGEKKKQRKEMIAIKRRERMLRRGIDLEQINLKLRNMVLGNVDIMSFQPMHTRECSQVQKLAAIYRLRSGSQGSGKKRFVIVTRTQHTSMPCASDQIRLEKLIGPSKDDGDFRVTETRKEPGSARILSSKISASRSFNNEKKFSGKKSATTSYASQPVSFVSSGVMESNKDKADAAADESKRALEIPDSANFGAFELHTKGFGSKMMAKMGYVEGSGLGKEGNGMAAPIEVTQRPKSLGLGVKFSETTDCSSPAPPPGSGSGRRAPLGYGYGSGSGSGSGPSIGSFEKHTKGFGSKMMAKMGFREGTGLGRDSQGMHSPIAAVRRPKARGLGAEKQY